MADYNYLSDGRPAGTLLGNDAADKVGFFGKAPAVQQTAIADATDAATAITKCNAVILALETLGLLAS